MDKLDGFKKYLSLRDHPLKNTYLWIKGRVKDDDCGNYWRVHNNLYDLTSFIDKHPGGKQWIELTRGTDVTEYFETFHLKPNIQDLLAKFYHGPANGPRNVPFTFESNGFYLTLKKRAIEVLSELNDEIKKTRQRRVHFIHNFLLFSVATTFMATAFTQSFWMAAICGFIASLMHNCTHTFAHKRENWRRYCMNFGFFSSFEFRVNHCLSHHAYPNTIYDLECSVYEPFADHRVYDKPLLVRCLGVLGLLTLSQTTFLIGTARNVILLASQGEGLGWESLVPFSEIAVLVTLGTPWIEAINIWLVIHAVNGYFISLIGLISAHHHPDLYHMGDGEFRYGNDWGLAQLDAVRDRKDVNGNLFAELTMFGNHVLHHMFPTVDPGLLDFIRPVFEATCKEFSLPVQVYRSHCFYDQWELFVGYFRQILRTTPRIKNSTK